MEESKGEIIETVKAARKILVSYDANARRGRERTRLNQFLFGRSTTVLLKDRRKRYEYPGLVSRPGVERVGQSVLIMRQKDADDLTYMLRQMRIPYMEETVWVKV